ncbi:MAG: GIY-YIG nuclease family protein [Candidatus Methanoperedens sp.]|nr:GIY-YIG nuclease family protein [Candidatus Methanoperedens sp.]MCZ7406726.1 GIY-YIG nuclease family protein [Candidatus Methanoperedens sp.]
MVDEQVFLWGICLQKVCDIDPEIDERGKIIEYRPQSEYKNYSNLPLHTYGGGSFCRFKIPSAWLGKEGVYIIYVEDIPKYVGECDNLKKRFDMGYGNISPRNCFEGGQSTNCRINKEILSNKMKGSNVTLYFIETDRRFDIEHYLISKINPEWNRTVGKPSLRENHSTHKNISSPSVPKKRKLVTTISLNSSGKYIPLEKYLSKVEVKEYKLSFSEIESIFGFPLPISAYKHHAWWSNGGHNHANAWLNSGWMVSECKLGDYIIFTKKTNDTKLSIPAAK